jgi:hypothetical protein
MSHDSVEIDQSNLKGVNFKRQQQEQQWVFTIWQQLHQSYQHFTWEKGSNNAST